MTASWKPIIAEELFNKVQERLHKNKNKYKPRQSKEKLRSQSMDLIAQEIDENGLKQRIQSAINRLEISPAEKQRPIFSNLIKFIEIHPTKIKKESFKATGTDGISINFKKEGRLTEALNRTAKLVQANTVGIGAEVTEVDEPLATSASTLFRSEPVFQAEFEVVAEPKALLPGDLRDLVKKHGGYNKAGVAIGASEAFVRQNSGLSRKCSKKRVR